MKLFISRDAGLSYSLDRTADTLEELQARMRELDGNHVRYYVKAGGMLIAVSKIHKKY
jgi:hypothetical protein